MVARAPDPVAPTAPGSEDGARGWKDLVVGAPLPLAPCRLVDGTVDPTDEDDVASEAVAELRRQREPVLLVDRVLVGSVEHALGRGSLSPTEPHLTPLFPTPQPLRPTRRSGPSLQCLAL